MRALTLVYNETKEYTKGGKLRDRLKDELHGDVERLALDLLEGNRNENEQFVPNCERAEDQAAELLTPGHGPICKLKKAAELIAQGKIQGAKSDAEYFIDILANEHFKQIRLIIEMFKGNAKGNSIAIFKKQIDKIADKIQNSQNIAKTGFYAIANRVVKSSNETNKEAFKRAFYRIVDIAAERVNEEQLGKMMKSCEKLNEDGRVENLSINYFVTAAEKDASALREAMKGPGTNEKAIIWILVTRKNNREIQNVYKTMFGNDLIDRIKQETGGIGEENFQNALLQLLQTSREDSTTFKPDKIRAKKQAVQLYAASSQSAPMEFIKMMATVHLDQLLLVFDEYEKLYKIDNAKKLGPGTTYSFEELLKKKQKFGGDFLRTLLAIVSLARKGLNETELDLEKKASQPSFFKRFWNFLVETYKGYKPVTELEIKEFKQFVTLCDDAGAEGQACASTQKSKEIRELQENYFTKKITRALKDMLGIFKMPSTKLKSKIDLHRLIIARHQNDLGEILRSIDRLSLKQIVDRFEEWRFSFSGLMKGKVIENADKLFAHALKRLLNIENARKIIGYDEFLENYGKNLLNFMHQIDNDQYSFGVEMRRPKKGEDARLSVNTHLYALPPPVQKENETPMSDDEIQMQYKNILPDQLRKKENLQKYLSDSMFIHDLIQLMCQDLIDRLDLMYRGRFRKAMLSKSDIEKFDRNIVGSPKFREALLTEWKMAKMQSQLRTRQRKQQNEEAETIKPEWKIWGDIRNEDTRRELTKALYEDHVTVFKLLFWARLYALAIALQRVPVLVSEDNEPPTISKEEGAKLFGYNDYADIYENPKNGNAKGGSSSYSRRTKRGINDNDAPKEGGAPNAKKIVVYNDFADTDDAKKSAVQPEAGKEKVNDADQRKDADASKISAKGHSGGPSPSPSKVYNDFATANDDDGVANSADDDGISADIPQEMGATFCLDIPPSAWADQTHQKTEALRKKFESDMDVLEEYILAKCNHQMLYNGNEKFYQVGYETLRKLGYEDLLHGKKLRTMLVHEMEQMLEEVDTGVNKDSEDDFSLETVHFTKANVQLFRKGKNGTDQLSVVEKLIQRVFNWVDRMVDKCHRKALTKRNRMQRFLFDKLKSFTTELRGLFTGQQPAIKWVMKKCMPLLYHGGKYGMKLLKWLGRLFKPTIAWFKGSKDKMGYKHKKLRMESKKAMFGLLMEVDMAVQDNTNIKQQWRKHGDRIWAAENEKELEKIWAQKIEEAKVEELEPDTFQQISGMMKEGNDMPNWMLKTPKDSKTSSNITDTMSNSAASRRGKRHTIRAAMSTRRHAKPQQLFADEMRVRLKRKGGARSSAIYHASRGSSSTARRAAYHSSYSAPVYSHGGCYQSGYMYHSSYYESNNLFYTPSPKQLLYEAWTGVNFIILVFIVAPIANALYEVDCSINISWSFSSSSSYGNRYNYDYLTAQRLREREERRHAQEAERRRMRQKEDELDYEIAQWDKEITYGSKGNSTARRAKRSSSATKTAGVNSIGVGDSNNDANWWWYNVEYGKRRRKRAVGEDCGKFMCLMTYLIWFVVWIGGYFVM